MTFLPSKIPLIQAPMASAQGPELAIAVCRAGGLGSLPAAMLTPERLRDADRQGQEGDRRAFQREFLLPCRSRRPIRKSRRAGASGSPLTMPRPASIHPPFPQGRSVRRSMRALCAVIEETRPAVVSFHFGLPSADLLSRVKAAGALILSSATTVAEARWLEQHGADAIIAQGREAGGHRGMFLYDDIDAQPGLISLLPQVRDAVRLPVIAAGGISDGRAIAAAFALGADAVQIGTAYLRTPEATISPMHRAALASARDDATRLTNVFTGRPARGLINRFVAEVGPMSRGRAAIPVGGGSRGAAAGCGRKTRQRRLFAALGRRGRSARARGGRRGADAAAVGGGTSGHDGVERARP